MEGYSAVNMSQVIPFFNVNSYFREEVILDDVSYLLDFGWNERYQQWDLSILLPDETVILSGIKLVLNYQLFDTFEYLALPPGELYCVDTTEKETEVTRDNLGDTVQLVYIPEAEL